ncbi:NAD(P)-dependent glycerol-1-phosphate dehydrogenase [Candidatus Methanomassiliicoccus intestinalis]|uniref:NAD(P)-dependent glycerol-1-phosphate dehydrogenase n=1 Tax=Candidatus Methanomassiliicoccus intestinalis TaxID=1406512 RepID=UPI0037DCCF61
MDEGSFGKVRSMLFPRNVVIGHGVLEDIPQVCKDFGLSGKAVIITGGKTKDVAAETVASLLKNNNYAVETVSVGTATKENLQEVVDFAKDEQADFLIGVGGGSKIDLAKMAAMELEMEFISVPTSASHDGIASGRASIKGPDGPISMEAKTPLGIVADTSVIVKAPFRLLVAGCADVISNITAIKDWAYAERLRGEEFSRSACAMALYTSEAIIESADLIKPGVEESVWLALKPIIVSGVSMSVAGSSRPTSGSEHMFSHALDMIVPGRALHGEQCGVGCIMMMYLHGGDWMAVRDALIKLGAPTTARGLGVTKEEILEALTMAHKIRDRFTILGHQGLTYEAAERLAKITKVI